MSTGPWFERDPDGEARSDRPPPSGYCAVRIDVEDYGLLLTVCTNPDLLRRSSDRIVKVSDSEQAIAIVVTFLRRWVRRHDQLR